MPLDRVLGGKSAGALKKAFGITTVGELISHYPRRYAARGELTDMNTLIDGEAVTILAEVVSVTTRPMQQRRGTIVEVVISDGQTKLSLTFFNQRWREGMFRPGRRGLFAGEVSSYRGKRQLALTLACWIIALQCLQSTGRPRMRKFKKPDVD